MDYLLLGPEEGNKADWLDKEKKRVLKEHPDAEVHQFYMGDDDRRDASLTFSQSSLFSDFRLLIVKQYEMRAGRDKLTPVIIEYLSEPHEDAELIILSSESSTAKIDKKITQAIGKEGTVMFWEMFDSDKRRWIRQAFRQEGLSVTDEAVDEILLSVDNNTQDMKALVSSLALFFRLTDKGKKTVTDEDIGQYALRTRGEDGYTLFQSVAAKDLEHSLLIMRSIASSDSQAASRAFSVLVSRFRLLEACHQLRASGQSMDDIAKNAVALSPYPGAQRKGLNARDKRLYAQAMKNYSLKETSDIISYLGDADQEVKAATGEIQETVLTEILYTIIVLKGKRGTLSLDQDPLTEGF